MKTTQILILALICLMVIVTSAQSTNQKWTERKAAKWFKKRQYLNGLSVVPHQSIDKVQFAEQYTLNKAIWDKAFLYLKETNLKTLSTGRHDIDGENIYATVSEGPLKDYDKTTFESHKKYIDLQLVISGEEKMGKASPAELILNKPYSEENDIMFYAGDGKIYTVPENTFILFFPSNAHRPSISPGGNKIVKKIVVKIRVAGA